MNSGNTPSPSPSPREGGKAPKRLGALSVQERFVPLIRKGIKTTTIRAERKDGARPYVGDVLPIYAKMRTPQCYWVADVRVVESLACHAISEGMALPELRLTQTWRDLCQQEGFASAEEMRAWFTEHHPEGLKGWLCSWEVVRIPMVYVEQSPVNDACIEHITGRVLGERCWTYNRCGIGTEEAAQWLREQIEQGCIWRKDECAFAQTLEKS